MSEPGEQRPSSSGGGPTSGTFERTAEGQRGWKGWQGQAPGARARSRQRSLGSALLLASLAALLTGIAWAVLRSVFELGVTALAAATLGGLVIGLLLRQARGPVVLAALFGAMAWLLGLVLSWWLAMALLPGSSRTFQERLANTPFLDWLAPQFGLLELAGLALCAGAAAYAARPRRI